MGDFCRNFLSSNEWQYRMLRTVIQGIIGVILANIDLIVGTFVIDPLWKGIIVASCMTFLSPVMARLGQAGNTQFYSGGA